MRSSHDGYSRRDRGNHHNSPYPRHPPPQHSNGHRNHYMNSSQPSYRTEAPPPVYHNHHESHQPLRPKIDYNTPISEMVSPYNVGSRPVHPRIVPPRLQEEKLSDQDHIKEYKECISKVCRNKKTFNNLYLLTVTNSFILFLEIRTKNSIPGNQIERRTNFESS